MLNFITIMGRLTAAPELKNTSSGVPVCSVCVAVERDYAQGGEKQTDFINCILWRQTAEFVSRYFSKGQMIIIQGSLESRHYETSAGDKRVAWEINAARAYFGETKRNE